MGESFLLPLFAALLYACLSWPASSDACERASTMDYRAQVNGQALLLPLDHATACRSGCEYLPRAWDAPPGQAWFLATGRTCSEQVPAPKARRCLGTYGTVNGEPVCLGGKGWKLVDGSKG